MEIKLKDKRTVKIKKLTVEDEAKILDILAVMFKTNDGKNVEVVEPNLNSLKALRVLLDDPSDKNIKSLSIQDRTDIIVNIQKMLNMGEYKPSK
tara:strand:- start:131 stop:412 length:282 start_codon:yes stop_codon:yes gene_type:complete